MCFFFQAEDGIRDLTVTGVQTCALPILGGHPQHLKKPDQLGRLVVGANNTIREHATLHRAMKPDAITIVGDNNLLMAGAHRSEERRVGKECRSRWSSSPGRTTQRSIGGW